ncbi:FAR1-related sequence 5-like protein [Tanacetum coccineum]
MRETHVDLQSQGNYTLFRETMALPAQNINHSAFRSMFDNEKLSGTNFNDWFARLKLVLRVEKKMHIIEQPLPPPPAPISEPNVVAEWTKQYDAHTEIACLMLGSMTPELDRQFELYYPYDMIQELRSMFEIQAGVEKFDLIQSFHACKQEEGKPVADYVLKMKGYVEKLECLGYVLPQDITVGLILNGLTKDFAGFVSNYKMHNMGKTIGEIHAMLMEYNMKFVPFIGIDNHGKCVTLGSGMLLHEDTKSYTWLLTAFMSAFLKEPTMIVTDQDGAMKRAIEAVFKKAKHRLCMWHIMQKIPTKICKEIYDQTDFKERFDKIVWNMSIEPVTFEEKWAQLIEAFDLKNHKWLTKMFDLREIWIPAYFIDSPLFGLMRTTSRSESENSFFKSFTSPGATLVSFMMSYESAMERQRYRQEKLDFNTIDAAPKFITQLDIESHASKVYTRTMFLIVQTEINEGCWNCTVQGLNRDEGCENFVIRDNKPNENKSLFHKKKQQKGKEKEKETQTVGQTARDYKVLLNIEDGSVNRDIKVIPKQYILRRWTRDIIPPDLRRKENRYGEKNVNIQRLTNEANFLVDDTLFLLSKDEEKMGTYVTNLKKLLDDVKTDMPNPPSRDTVIEDVFSVKQTNDVQVKNPTKAVNKGEHLKKGERLKSEREKAIKVAKKKARPCGFCKEVTNEHTKLTCPLNPNARKKRKATPVIDV